MCNLFVGRTYESRAWGFPFHCSCWELLRASSPTGGIHIQTLFDLCRSFPVSPEQGDLDFGHDYGNIHKRRYRGEFPPTPGEETEDWWTNVGTVPFETYESDPVNAYSFVKLVDEEVFFGGASSPPRFICETITAYDIFGRFLAEIFISFYRNFVWSMS